MAVARAVSDLALALATLALGDPETARDPAATERRYLVAAAVRVALMLRLEETPELEPVLTRFMDLVTRPSGAPGFDGRTFRIHATAYSEVHSVAGVDGVVGVFSTYAKVLAGPDGAKAREAARAGWEAARRAADELLEARG